jgi:hypothetical protein
MGRGANPSKDDGDSESFDAFKFESHQFGLAALSHPKIFSTKCLGGHFWQLPQF